MVLLFIQDNFYEFWCNYLSINDCYSFFRLYITLRSNEFLRGYGYY